MITTLDRMSASSKTVDNLLRDGYRLGTRQQGCLKALLRHGIWPGGWVWDNYSGTQRVLGSLVKRGLAQMDSSSTYYTPSERVDRIYREFLSAGQRCNN